MKEIEFTQEKFEKFKLEYNKSVSANKAVFTFDGDEYVTAYAKYVIEYLTNKFKSK